MAKPKRFRKEFGPWPRGLDERPPLTLDEKALSVCYNMRVVWPSGVVQFRPGTRRILQSGTEVPTPVLNGTVYNTGGGPRHVVIAGNGGLYYSGTGLDATQTMTTDGTTPFSTTKIPQFATFYDNTGAQALYIADGAGKVSKLVGATLTARVAATTPATVYRLAVYNERLFACSGSDSTLYFSGLGNGDSLGDTTNGGGQIIIRPVNGDKLIGLLAIGQTLILFFEGSIGRFTGWSQDDIDLQSGTRGLSATIGLYSVTNIPVAAENSRGFFYGNDSEIYEVTEAGITLISGPLDSFRRLLTSAAAQITLGQIGIWPHRGEVWFGTTAGAYIYNYRFPCWAGLWQDANVYGNEVVLATNSCFWNYLAGSTEKMFAGANAGNFVLADSSAVSGTGQRCFGSDYVNADGTGGNLIAAYAFLRPMLSSIGGHLVTRFNHFYLSLSNISGTLTAIETVGNVSRTGIIPSGGNTTQSALGTLAGPNNISPDGTPEFVVARFAGQSQGNQVSLGFSFSSGATAISELGEFIVAKAAVEGWQYPTRTDAGPSL